MPSTKNIWIAAGDGDLERVTELIEQQSLSANIADPFTYTPMHAAASYGQIHVLEYLITKGGDVNITDADGDTPLYTVEDVNTAKWLVDHGAMVDRRNSEGISPVEHLTEDFPQVASYLQTLLPPGSSIAAAPLPSSSEQPSQHSQNLASEELTSRLMSSVEEIMARCQAEGIEPDEDTLREMVSRHVLEGVITGFQMSENARGEGGGQDRDPEGDRREPTTDDTPVKKPRTDNSQNGST